MTLLRYYLQPLLLLQLEKVSALTIQVHDSSYILWQIPEKDYYFTYDSSIMPVIAIITFQVRNYYDTYCHYDTIIVIIVIWHNY